MAEFPALPLFTDAFIADTTHLNAQQTGAYLMLLMCAWRLPDCRLPNDDKFLARAARMDGRAWSANKSSILAFWKQDEQQKWYQRRLLDERKYVEDMKRKNSDAGKASALKRKERHSTTVQPDFNETSTPTPTPYPHPLAADKSAAKQQGKKNPQVVFGEAEVNIANPGDSAYDPPLISTEILPGGWYDQARKQGLNDERVYKSFRKFKDLTDYPYSRARWSSWLENEGMAA